jgi:hypothetical protein
MALSIKHKGTSGGNHMERNKRLLVAGICALLTVLLVFSVNVAARQVTITDEGNGGYQIVADEDYEDSGGWLNKDNPEDNEEGEETDEESPEPPSDTDEEPPTEAPSPEEGLPVPDENDDVVMNKHMKW